MQHHEQQEKRRNTAAAERTALLAAFRATFTSEHGKRVLHYLQSSAGCLPGHERPCFLPTTGGNVSDACAAAFRDGRKSLLYEITNLLATPEDTEPPKPPAALV